MLVNVSAVYSFSTVKAFAGWLHAQDNTGMVDLFNSASSLAGGALANPADAALFEAYYKANLSLHKAAARPTFLSGLSTGKVASGLIGKNLASQLQPSAADLARYGITTSTPAKLSAIGTTLITTAKSFALNLTAHVMLPKPVRGCSELKRWAMRIARRAGMRKAKVALARKLAVIMHRMLANGTTFHAA